MRKREWMSRMLVVETLVATLVVMAIVLGGCCTLGVGPCTITDRFVLVGGEELNSCGGDDRSHPVAVQFFALKGTKAFQGATFEDLWREPGQTLGGELVGEPEKVFVEPGGRLTMPLVRAADVKAIGVLANFCERDDRSSRRHVFELGKSGVKKQLVLRGISLSVE